VRSASGKAQPRRAALGSGAAQAAPTAPHATPRLAGAPRTGPERFWARWPATIALAVSITLSTALHGSLLPLDLPTGFETREVEGNPTIPIDVLTADEPPAPSPPAAPAAQAAPPPEPAVQDETPGVVGPKARDGRDGGPSDAAPDAPAREADAAVAAVAPAAAQAGDASVPVARADALDASGASDGPSDGGRGGPREPEEIVSDQSVRADVVLVELFINAEVIRGHPLGPRLGNLLRAIPQWDDFLNGTDIDPVRDTDWVLISGPSLVDTSRDSVLIHYSAPDAVVDRAVSVVSRKYARGGAFDAGVRGIKAVLAHADRAERVIFRPRPHWLAVVPPWAAARYAPALATGRLLEHPHAGDAVYVRLADPHHPWPEVPETITVARLRVVASADAGADVFIEGDTKDADAASEAAEGLRRLVRRHNDLLTSMVTHGLLDHVEVTTEDRVVKAHLTASGDQIEAILAFVESFLGLQSPTAADSSWPRTAPPHPAGRPGASGGPRGP